MAIASLSGDEPFRQEIRKDEYLTMKNIHSEDYDIFKQIPYLEGPKWTVDYFNQDLGYDDTITTVDPSAPVALQPRIKISNLDLIVIEEIPLSIYENISGRSLFYAGNMRPYVGDLFIASALNGDIGIFVLDNVDIKTYASTKVYEVGYKIYAFGSESTNIISQLLNSVNRKFNYNREHFKNNSGLLLTDEENINIKKLKDFLPHISNTWLNKFKDFKTGLFLIKNQEYKIVDYRLEQFMFSILNFEDYKIDVLNSKTSFIPFNGSIAPLCIYDLLLNFNNLRLNNITKQFTFVNNIGIMGRDIKAGDLRYLGYNYILFPCSLENDLEAIESLNGSYTSYSFNNTSSSIVAGILPDLNNVFNIEKNYLFTNNFYNKNNENLSKIELLLLTLLDKKILNYSDLLIVMESVNDWSDLELYFYLPILYLLINYAICNSYSIAL